MFVFRGRGIGLLRCGEGGLVCLSPHPPITVTPHPQPQPDPLQKTNLFQGVPRVVSIILKLMFTGNIPELPDDEDVQKDLLSQADFLLLEQDLRDTIHSCVADALSTNTICTIYSFAKERQITTILQKCETFLKSNDTTEMADLFLSHSQKDYPSHRRRRVR